MKNREINGLIGLATRTGRSKLLMGTPRLLIWTDPT